MKNYITVDSFGSECPDNWEEIAEYLNGIIRERDIADDHNAVNDLWDDFWKGYLEKNPDDFTD